MRSTRAVVAAAVAAIVVLSAAAAFLSGAAPPADGSVLSRGAGGLLLARRYLEARGTPVRLVDETLSPGKPYGTLVLVFPWQSLPLPGEEANVAVARHLYDGGDVLFGYSGSYLSFGEREVATALGLSIEPRTQQRSLLPWKWWQEARRLLELRGPADGPAFRGEMRAPEALPVVPAGARTLLESDAGVVAFRYERGRGRVFVVPSEILGNARLPGAGHADLLEWLRGELPGDWSFDEFHHGLSARADGAAAAPNGLPVDALLFQIALVYLAVLFTLARRFGPAWSDPPSIRSSVRTFLVGLGELHHRLGHHAVAAAHLASRARELDPRLELRPETLPLVRGMDPAALVETARAVSRAQQGGSR
jgi:hypothetical protein